MVIRIEKFYAVVFAGVLLAAAFILGLATKNIAVETSVPAGTQLPVIMYHHITDSPEKAGKYVVTAAQLENDLCELKNRGYQTVSASQAADYAAGIGSLPQKPVILTFDDGFESVYAYAFPLLKKYGMTAEVFVVGSIADFYSKANDHNLAYSYLTWEEIGEMSASGAVNIQNHTDSLHSNTGDRDGMKKRPSESAEHYKRLITDDLLANQRKIEKAAGKSPCAVAYPFGSFGSDTAKTVSELGFRAAFTCEEKVNTLTRGNNKGLLTLGRFNRSGNLAASDFFEKLG